VEVGQIMKLKNFRDLIEERFSKDEIALIEQQAELEVKVLRSLQDSVKKIGDKISNRTKVQGSFEEIMDQYAPALKKLAKN
jgi:hypothetical protein